MSAPELAFALAGSNVVDAGTQADPPKDTAEVVYSGNVAEQKDVTIEFFEVDPGENKKPQKPKKLATFKADIIPVATPAAGQPPGELKLTQKPADKIEKDIPRLNLKLAGETFQIGLKDLKSEAGRRFEIQLKASAKGKKGALKFESKVLLFARFGRFKKEPRAPVITFVTGGEDQGFFEASAVFWRQHADLVVQQDGMSLQEIVAFLAAQSSRVMQESGDKGWGEVNIVCHGNPISAAIKILASSTERNLRIFQLDRVLAGNPSAFSAASLGLTSDSRVVFRACDIGQRADLLKRIAADVFGGVCVVKAPKFLQRYAAAAGDSSTRAASESFFEEVRIHMPVDAKPADDDAAVQTALAAKFKRAQDKRSPDDRQAFAVEKPTFTVKKIEKVSNAVPFRANNAAEHEVFLNVDLDTMGATTPEAAHLTILDADDTDNFDFTRSPQWKAGAPKLTDRTAVPELEVRASSAGAKPPRALTGVGNPVIIGANQALSGQIDGLKGGNTVPNAIFTTASGLTDAQSIVIDNVSATAFRVTASGGATFTSGGQSRTSITGTVTGNATVTIDVGTEKLTISRSHRVRAELPLTRHLVSFRRELREPAPKKAFADRAPVVPDVDDPSHYGSSDDTDPSETELRELGE